MGARVSCEVRSAEVEFKGRVVPGVCLTCTRCGHEVTVGGEEQKSVRRGLAMLRDECPENESNFYVNADDEED